MAGGVRWPGFNPRSRCSFLGLAGHYQIRHKALTDTPCHYTVAAQHLHTLHTHWGCTLGHIVVGLSAVPWISIPAAASMVTRKRTNDTIPTCSSHYSTMLILYRGGCVQVAEWSVGTYDHGWSVGDDGADSSLLPAGLLNDSC